MVALVRGPLKGVKDEAVFAESDGGYAILAHVVLVALEWILILAVLSRTLESLSYRAITQKKGQSHVHQQVEWNRENSPETKKGMTATMKSFDHIAGAGGGDDRNAGPC